MVFSIELASPLLLFKIVVASARRTLLAMSMLVTMKLLHRSLSLGAGVSILSKNHFFYKGGYESLEFFIRRHYVVFTKNKVVVYKKSAFFLRCVRFHDIQ